MLALMGCGKDKKTGNNFFELDNPQKVEVYDSCNANEPPIEVTDQKVIAEICDLIQSAKLEEGGWQGEGGFGVKVICKSKSMILYIQQMELCIRISIMILQMI